MEEHLSLVSHHYSNISRQLMSWAFLLVVANVSSVQRFSVHVAMYYNKLVAMYVSSVQCMCTIFVHSMSVSLHV